MILVQNYLNEQYQNTRSTTKVFDFVNNTMSSTTETSPIHDINTPDTKEPNSRINSIYIYIQLVEITG